MQGPRKVAEMFFGFRATVQSSCLITYMQTVFPQPFLSFFPISKCFARVFDHRLLGLIARQKYDWWREHGSSTDNGRFMVADFSEKFGYWFSQYNGLE